MKLDDQAEPWATGTWAQRTSTALTFLNIHGFLSDGEKAKAITRLLKRLDRERGKPVRR